ncbi:thiamine pyrophosphokinase [Coemansia biformis]|uniref:Thiamine pyrophosphokinase n=1 Tax=Coemansia biformis TaxID=1286918 RepID=A0A9W8CWV1_9FUNG|nr:thiamine pyrophosphokinase [Coemansia biformis]
MESADTVHQGSHLLYPGDWAGDAPWPAARELALVILNEPIPPSAGPLLAAIWARASYRICADGGGNRLYALCKEEGTLGQFVPDAVVGDLDSLKEAPRSYFEESGVVIHRYRDQDSTDFMKGLDYLDTVLRRGKDTRSCPVVVLGGLGGRLDHIMHTLKVLFNQHLQRQIVVVSGENLTFVLPAGRNRILTNPQVDGPTCGILPLAGETTLTTKGLRWNLDHHPSSFEGLMSTSNIVDEREIIVETTAPVAWTTEFRPKPA